MQWQIKGRDATIPGTACHSVPDGTQRIVDVAFIVVQKIPLLAGRKMRPGGMQ